MATFKISSTGTAGTLPSVFTTSGNAFASGSALADSLTVDAGAFLITNDTTINGRAGAVLDNTGAWTVTVNGTLFSGGLFGNGILINPGNVATSTITVGTEGSLSGTNEGIAAGSSATIKNAGLITGVYSGIDFFGGTTQSVINSGVIQGGLAATIWDQTALGGKTTVTNTGTIIGFVDLGLGDDTLTNSGTLNGYVKLGDGTNKLTNSGSITSKDGSGRSILGGLGADTVSNTKTIDGGISLDTGSNDTFANSLTNSGTIGKSIDGSSFAGGDGIDAVTNSGTLNGYVTLSDGTNSLTNSGTIGAAASGVSLFGGTGADTVSNIRTLVGTVQLSLGTNLLTNSGTIGKGVGGDSYFGGSGNDTVTNSGTLDGFVQLDTGTNKVTNSGYVGVDANGVSIFGGSGNDTISNSKTIAGGIELGDGANKLSNSGTIGTETGGAFAAYSVVSGGGVDTITNSGTLSGFVFLGDGDDVFTNFVSTKVGTKVVVKAGTVGGVVLGDGADKFSGGLNSELVFDGNGADTYNLGGGNDFYVAAGNTGTDGNDTIDGGAGIDTYNAGNATNQLFINLDTIDHANIHGFAVTLIKNQALGTDVASGITTDKVINFENVAGGTGSDIIFGSSGANVISGNGGSDVLNGFGGNDTLIGGSTGDFIIGGTGADTLTGLGGADTFFFTKGDSGVTAATRDVITDFVSGVDELDLSALATAYALPFVTYINGDSTVTPAAMFNGIAGAMRSYWVADGVILELDANGDKTADFSLKFLDPTHTLGFDIGDVII